MSEHPPIITGAQRVFVDGKEVADVREVEIVAGARPTAVIVDELSPQADEYLESCKACMRRGCSLGKRLDRLPKRVLQAFDELEAAFATQEEITRLLRPYEPCPVCRGTTWIKKSKAIKQREEEIQKLKAEVKAQRERAERAEDALDEGWSETTVEDMRKAGRELFDAFEVLLERLKDVDRGIADPDEVVGESRRALEHWRSHVGAEWIIS